eukprot:9101124-Ditylum_brightwellii.AAC.1
MHFSIPRERSRGKQHISHHLQYPYSQLHKVEQELVHHHQLKKMPPPTRVQNSRHLLLHQHTEKQRMPM